MWLVFQKPFLGFNSIPVQQKQMRDISSTWEGTSKGEQSKGQAQR